MVLSKNSITRLLEWQSLIKHQESMWGLHMRDLHADDPKRFEKFHIEIDGLLFDYSKHLITEETIDLFIKLAHARNLEKMRDDMFAGMPINTSENRAVLHTAARGSHVPDLVVDGQHIGDFFINLHQQMKRISDEIRQNKNITDIVNIGIGGSDIGPYMVCKTLAPLADGPTIHFVSNIDGDDLMQKLDRLNPASTAFIVSSKTFTTLETIENAKYAKKWANGKSCFIAVTSNAKNALDFGAVAEDILPLPDWIGGRFSVWSGIGLSICIAFGFDMFKELLRGARAADEHFETSSLDKNIPVIMGLLGIWYQNFWNFIAHGILPYAQNLRHFPRYVRQIDMESNGKQVTKDGTFVDYATGPLIFGDTGTSAQHAFFQSLHQGTDTIPCDFIVPIKSDHDIANHHKYLIANALAQSQALMIGQENENKPHKNFFGNRPSSTILINRVDPYHLGLLMAFYEHKVFVQGVIWNINSFDQWGVELGKTLAKDLAGHFIQKSMLSEADSSTKGLMRYIQSKI